MSRTLRNLLLLFLHNVLHHLQHVQLHTYLVCTDKPLGMMLPFLWSINGGLDVNPCKEDTCNKV
jgi:hypothetical protein